MKEVAETVREVYTGGEGEPAMSPQFRNVEEQAPGQENALTEEVETDKNTVDALEEPPQDMDGCLGDLEVFPGRIFRIAGAHHEFRCEEI